jgi:2-polyprenyl-3-methyl-5-hydroxy-6-metoxy-1,4-benzoquinol methylase
MNFIKGNDKIIDLGCGTGIHAGLISKKGYIVDGLDLSKEMLDIAKTRLNSSLYQQSILDININKKYDVIISMFAVINHLKDTNELEICLSNMKNILNDRGIIIIDLHNPQSSGNKMDSYDNISRVMEWNYDSNTRIEKSKIYFEVDNHKYESSHIFRIFSIDEVKECCNKVGLKVINVYENYDINKEGSSTSKNLQFVISSI